MTRDILWVTATAPAAMPDLPEGWRVVCMGIEAALHHAEQPQLLIADLANAEAATDLALHFANSIRVLAVPDCQDEFLLPHVAHYHLFCLQPVPEGSFSRFIAVAVALIELGLQPECRRRLLACTHLPLIPPLVQQLQQLLLDPDVRVDKLAALIEQDVVLSARLLQLANSAYMGFSHETSSVQMAISRLGLSLLYGVVLALSVAEQAAQGQDLTALRLIGHCRQIGEWLNYEQTLIEQMVLGALFYQLGVTLLHDAEGDVSELSAAEAGAFMLTLWGFATPVAKALLAQRDLSACLKNPAALGLYLARQRQQYRPPEPALEKILLRLGLRQYWPAE